MDLNLREEKKEAKEEVKEETGVTGDSGSLGDATDDIDIDEELVALPADIAARLGNRSFTSEEELQLALAEIGVGDLPVVLVDGDPRLVMPSDQHNEFTTKYVVNFTKAKGNWGLCSATHKIHFPDGKSRDPDLSFWGYPRCNPSLEEPENPGSIPDVVIQFSWQNKQWYEEDAINDMMNRGLDEDHGSPSTTRPVLGYLIKVRFSKKRTLAGAIKGSKTQDMEGLEIYKLSHGTTVADALDPSNPNAEHWQYTRGGPEVHITIAPRHLGITGLWAWFCGDYTIKASGIFDTIQEYHRERQRKGLAT